MKNDPLHKLPARSMQDLALQDDVTRPDFELGQHDLELSKELTRLSFLGIAGYGFLIKEVVLRGDVELRALVSTKWFTVPGVILLGIAAGSSLWHAQTATHCLDLQVEICRLLQRKTNDGWEPEERSQNDEDLGTRRNEQSKVIKKKRLLLGIAVWALILGGLIVAADFGWILLAKSLGSDMGYPPE
ncbi:hypothetical protein JAO29_01805 [Edaphobacter sp. HDX4]|uniref:hypothetical protein n=1 Tax=Edaphobacter sp. HDX4 TaxID=2794064 RepID=UPI002FE5C96F